MVGIIGNRPQDWVVEGGTITTVTRNGVLWQVNTLISTSALIIRGPRGVVDTSDAYLFAEYLLIAGGGGGGGARSGSPGYNGGGAGGGGVRHGFGRFRPGAYAAIIGGGAAGGVIGNNGLVGSNSTALGLTADGGGYGGAGMAGIGNAGGPGGNGGAGGAGGVGTGTGGLVSTATTPAQGRAGPTTDMGNQQSSSVGGGLAGGADNTPYAIRRIKNGFACDIDGTMKTYASGGMGAVFSGAGAGAANTGDGGDGSAGGNDGYAGGSGVFIFAFPTS